MFGTIAETINTLYTQNLFFRLTVCVLLAVFSFRIWGYLLIGIFTTRKFKPAQRFHKYAILIAARNEKAVIGNLLDSIQKQDYPQDYLTVFVVADNCTDDTAAVAREKGAICYERFDDVHLTKGYALQFLFENIKNDYGIESFEGYFIFDADNLLNADYVSRMNDSFDAGEKIITSYRNTKNFDENWIASSYAIHWLRTIRAKPRARSVLRLATNIQGTGFLFANELVRDGWKYTSLTEDRAFTADAVAHGYAISYNDAAEFFDEQPTSLKIAFRQRIRWSKGHLLAFVETGWLLFKNIFVGNSFRDETKKEKTSKKNLINGFRQRWASFDILAQLVPTPVLDLFKWIVLSLITACILSWNNGVDCAKIFNGDNFVARFLNEISGSATISVLPGMEAVLITAGLSLLWNVISKLSSYIIECFTAIYVFFAERSRIIKIPLYKKILYTITWPVFDVIGRWSMYIALFRKVEWKPIPHTSSVTINQIENSKKDVENGKHK